MYKLYYTTRSFTTESTALIARIALEELGQPYEVEEVELSPAPPDWYLGLNRHGQIPTLAMTSDKGEPTLVAPSSAILLALAERHADGGLLPETSQDRAACYACLFDMVEKLHSRYMQVFSPERYSAESTHADAIRLAAFRAIGAYFAFMDAVLARQPFVSGARYSICDIYFYVMARWYVDVSPADGLRPFESYGNIVAYCGRIEARTAVHASLRMDEIAPIGASAKQGAA